MPTQSESQRILFCLARGIKEGSLSAEKFPQAAKVADGMTLEQLLDY